MKTDRQGNVLKQITVATHHGDLCFLDGKVFFAVNLGRFNDPKGNADSWVYVYDAETLEFVTKHETQEAFHGAGGIVGLAKNRLLFAKGPRTTAGRCTGSLHLARPDSKLGLIEIPQP